MIGFANIKNYFDNLKGQTKMTNELKAFKLANEQISKQARATDKAWDKMLEASPTLNVGVPQVGLNVLYEFCDKFCLNKSELVACAESAFYTFNKSLKESHPAPPNTVDKAAYDGAREDLAIWKKRALEAENKVKIYDQRIVDIGAIAMKPVKVKQPPNTDDQLKKDAERLDWVDAVERRAALVLAEWFKHNYKIREAIDKAMEGKSCPPHKWDKSGETCLICGEKDWMG